MVDFESKGRGFKSLRARSFCYKKIHKLPVMSYGQLVAKCSEVVANGQLLQGEFVISTTPVIVRRDVDFLGILASDAQPVLFSRFEGRARLGFHGHRIAPPDKDRRMPAFGKGDSGFIENEVIHVDGFKIDPDLEADMIGRPFGQREELIGNFLAMVVRHLGADVA